MEQNDMMQQRKERILAYIESETYIPLKQKELRLMLDVPAEDQPLFEELLRQLIEEGRLFETKKGKLISPKKLQMATGTFIGHNKGFGFVTPDEPGEDIFIPASETLGALQKDRVLFQVVHRAENGKKADGSIIRILERGVQRVVGTFMEDKKGYGFVLPDDKKIAKDIFISREQKKGAVNGHKVVAEIMDYGGNDKNPEGKILEIIGHINDPGVDILSVIRKYDLPMEFSEEVYAETEQMETEVAEQDKIGREDIRHWLTITIDGEDAKDLDDAVTLQKLENGNFLLGVHIADVSHYVKENTALDAEAYRRATSIYLVDRVIPMLPHKLSNGICSLNPQTDRLTLSCIMEIDQNGNVLAHRIAETLIYSDYRMTYATVREILEEPTPDLLEQYRPIVPMLEEMEQLRRILNEKRKKRGSIQFDLPESKIILDAEGKPIEILPYERSVATNMIEEFMLVCNETIAENAFWQEIPFLYRSHQEPDSVKMEKMEQFLRGFGYYMRKKDGEIHPREIQKVLRAAEQTDEERIITRMVLRSMMQARYTAENGGHFGLAAKYYCHFTSPIRRYPDLVIHRMLKKMLHGEMDTQSFYRKNMPEWAKHTSKQERVAEDAERDTDALKKVEFMSGKIGERFSGIISGVTGWGIYVELPNTVEGMVALNRMEEDFYEFDEKNMRIIGRRTQKSYRLGDRVEIIVFAADRLMGTIDFLFAPQTESEN